MAGMSEPAEPMPAAVTGTLEAVETAPQTRLRSSAGDPANDWLCAWCLNRVASEKDRLARDGQSEFTFKNPEGIQFNIITFSQTIGCREAGVPTLEHTWFPDHAWSFCLCDRCHMHLGWFYSGPTDFAGLIRDHIIRALPTMN